MCCVDDCVDACIYVYIQHTYVHNIYILAKVVCTCVCMKMVYINIYYRNI
jgi:hypothetical protein